jgi:Domain of unknown function (DU1801)
MAELKTKKTRESVSAFIAGIEDPQARKDCRTLVGLMQAATGAEAKMWGSSIVGFGDYHYKSPATGREGDWFEMGFAPRKGTLTLYLMSGVHSHEVLLGKLGKHKTGKGCLYIKRLGDVDGAVLKKIIREAAKAEKMGETRA